MEEKKYLSAKEAHKIAANKSHIDEIMDQIKTACDKGLFKVYFIELAIGDEKKLKELGYRVMPSHRFIEVSW